MRNPFKMRFSLHIQLAVCVLFCLTINPSENHLFVIQVKLEDVETKNGEEEEVRKLRWLRFTNHHRCAKRT